MDWTTAAGKISQLGQMKCIFVRVGTKNVPKNLIQLLTEK